MAEKRVLLFTVPACIPCHALKEWFENRGLEYLEISAEGLRRLDQKVFENVLEQIRRVTKCVVDNSPYPTFPAVCVVDDDKRVWISNDGLEDVSGMVEKINATLST